MAKPTYTLDQRATVTVLKQIREEAGFTQRKVLSAQLGQRHNFVSMVELGQRKLRVPELRSYALACRKDPLEVYARMLRETALYVTEQESLAVARLATRARTKKAAKPRKRK